MTNIVNERWTTRAPSRSSKKSMWSPGSCSDPAADTRCTGSTSTSSSRLSCLPAASSVRAMGVPAGSETTVGAESESTVTAGWAAIGSASPSRRSPARTTSSVSCSAVNRRCSNRHANSSRRVTPGSTGPCKVHSPAEAPGRSSSASLSKSTNVRSSMTSSVGRMLMAAPRDGLGRRGRPPTCACSFAAPCR